MDVRLPDGTILRNVPEGTTKEQIAEKLAGQHGFPAADVSLADKAIGTADAGLAMLSGIVAEPIAGLAGIGAALNPFGDEGDGARAVDSVRDAMTYQPRTDEGQEYLANAGETLAPVGDALHKAEAWLGDGAYELTGSPAVAAAAVTLPTAVLEALGQGAMKRVAGTSRRAKQIDKLMAEAAPDGDTLKKAANSIYREIDDLGVSVEANAYAKLVDKIGKETRRKGLDSDVTPAANKAVKRFEDMYGNDVPLSEIETLREVAKGAAQSTNPKEAMLGAMIIDTTDDFLDAAGSTVLTKASDGTNVGKRYKVARQLWGRHKKSEMIDQALKDADLQASGLENGIRIQFRKILSNPKKRRFFNAQEVAEMTKVVKGTKGANAAKFLGRFGYTEGQATSALGASISTIGGATMGSAVGGTAGAGVGAVALPAMGQVGKQVDRKSVV